MEMAGDQIMRTLTRPRTNLNGHFPRRFSEETGGADRVRTCDPHNAIVVLYQLSYDPIQDARNLNTRPRLSKLFAASRMRM